MHTPAATAHPPRAVASVAPSGFSFRTRPALQPQFNPAVPHYVTRCEPAEKVTIQVSDTTGTPVTVDAQPVATRSFSTTVKIGRGQRFIVRAGTGHARASYSIACLPPDFPRYTAQVTGSPQASYYLMTPSSARVKAPGAPYVALFDNHGVPVWWYDDQSGSPLDASLAPNGDLTWDVYKNLFNRQASPALSWQMGLFGPPPSVSSGFNVPTGVDLVEHRLDGNLVKKVDTVGSPTDFHEGLPLANGNFLMTSYALRPNANLSPLFSAPTNALDATFQVVSPHGSLLSTWTAAGRISPAETGSYGRGPVLSYPGALGPVWDYQHIDSVAPDGNGYLVSLAHTNAVYLVSGSDGSVEWKLGGSRTAQSLTIVGDPSAGSDFDNPSDARAWPDGTVSVLDSGSNSKRPPRVLRFRIDPQAGTATLVQTLTDPGATASTCCGSARLLPGGDWVVAWGTSGIVDELAPSGQAVFRLTFSGSYYTYRAVPILPGQLRLRALLAGMDAMTPRIPSGTRPPALSRLRVLFHRGQRGLRVRFTLAWGAPVRFALARCASAAPGRRCTSYLPLQQTSMRQTKRGANDLVLFTATTARLSLGQYRLTATPTFRRRSGQRQAAVFRLR